MAEYIDKDSIVLDYSGLAKISPYDFMSIAEYFANQIKIKPAADVAPVRHGRFVHDGPRFAGGVDWWRCSSCGGLVSGVETRFDYCPHCGAKMDMEE